MRRPLKYGARSGATGKANRLAASVRVRIKLPVTAPEVLKKLLREDLICIIWLQKTWLRSASRTGPRAFSGR